MTQHFSIAYPIENGPSKWDLMLALFDRNDDVREIQFVIGSQPMQQTYLEKDPWSLALKNPPKVFVAGTSVIGVACYVSRGDSFHISGHVAVPRNLLAGCLSDSATSHLTMLADIFFDTTKRKGNIRFKCIPE